MMQYINQSQEHHLISRGQKVFSSWPTQIGQAKRDDDDDDDNDVTVAQSRSRAGGSRRPEAAAT